jgi:predicted secreted protein
MFICQWKGGVQQCPSTHIDVKAAAMNLDVFSKTFETKDVVCSHCGSNKTTRLLTAPLVRMEKASEPTTEFGRKEEPIEYYRKKGKFELAAKEAEKAGKSEWEVKRIREGKKF